RKALEIRIKTIGPEQPDTILSHHSLAFALNRQGKFTRALGYYQSACELATKTPATPPLLRVRAHNGLGTCLNNLDRFADAEVQFREALAIIKKLGDAQPQSAQNHMQLGYTLRMQEKHTEADAVLRQGIALAEKGLGPNHVLRGRLHLELGWSLMALKKYDDAVASFCSALAVFEKTGDELMIAAGCHNLAVGLGTLRRHAEAEQMARKALSIRQKRLGEIDKDTAVSHNVVGYNLLAQGKDAEALAHYQASVDAIEIVRLRG